MYNLNEIKELMAMGFTPEQISRMNQETPKVANAKAGEPKKPVDPMKQVIYVKEFEPKRAGDIISPDKFIGKGFEAKALRRVNAKALNKTYGGVHNDMTGWKFDDPKACEHALKNFKFIHGLTLEMYLEYLNTEEEQHLAQAEFFAKKVDEVKEKYGVK